MNFIERLLHVSPDGGDGSLEVAAVAALALVVAAVALRGRIGALIRRPSGD